mgnify:CR=1 FL=1
MFGGAYFGTSYFGDPYFGPKTIVPTGGKTKEKKWKYHSEDEEFYRLLSRLPRSAETDLIQGKPTVHESLSDVNEIDEMALILAIYESLD